MPERDTGEDKTDKAKDEQLAKENTRWQGKMPFYESEPDIPYADWQKKDKE